MKPLLVFDFETTGLLMHPGAARHLQPRAVEFGGMHLNMETGEIKAEFDQLINPEIPIPPEATKIHGITDEAVANSPTFEEFAPRLQAIFDECHACVAHNLPFDRQIAKYEFERAGIELRFPEKQFCTIDLYRADFGRDMKLLVLYEHVMGRKLDQKHRGLSDVVALVEIIREHKLYQVMM